MKLPNNYLMDIPYLYGHTITEYDMSKANISILAEEGFLRQNEYEVLANLDKKDREIRLGIMQRDNPKIKEAIDNGFEYYRAIFTAKNSLKREDIFSVKKDAIYVIDRTNLEEKITKYITFKKKNIYTSFLKVFNYEFYFGQNGQTFNFDVKGISDKNLIMYHMDGMCNIFMLIMEQLSLGDIPRALYTFYQFYTNYITSKLPIDFYRNFDADSQYKIVANSTQYYLEYVTPEEFKYVDIYYNKNLLLELHKILMDIAFNYNKRSH